MNYCKEQHPCVLLDKDVKWSGLSFCGNWHATWRLGLSRAFLARTSQSAPWISVIIVLWQSANLATVNRRRFSSTVPAGPVLLTIGFDLQFFARSFDVYCIYVLCNGEFISSGVSMILIVPLGCFCSQNRFRDMVIFLGLCFTTHVLKQS